MNSFENFRPRELNETEREILESLQGIEGAEVTPGIREVYSFIIRFVDDESLISIYVTFFDQESKADLAITNMTNLSRMSDTSLSDVRGKGRGSEMLQRLISWAKARNKEYIIATQVQEQARTFWKKNGFVYDERENNISEDWVYKPENTL
jgi:GNAT superfamily N-acetyltransferase